MIEGLHHIALIVSDEKASKDFYKLLGFEEIERHERQERGDAICMLHCQDVTLELFVKTNAPKRLSHPEGYGLRHVAFKCNHIQELHELLLRHGYVPEDIRQDSFTGEGMFFVKDPDGQPIELHEYEE